MCQSCDSSVVQNELAQRLSVQTHTSTFELVQLIDSSVTDRYTRVLYTRTAPGPVLVLPQCKCHCIDDVIGRLPHSPSSIVENCNSDVLPIVVVVVQFLAEGNSWFAVWLDLLAFSRDVHSLVWFSGSCSRF